MYINKYTYIHVNYIHIHICVYIYIFMYVWIFIYIKMYVCMYVGMYVCMCVCTYVYIYMCMYIYGKPLAMFLQLCQLGIEAALCSLSKGNQTLAQGQPQATSGEKVLARFFGDWRVGEASTGKSFGEEYWNLGPLVKQSSLRQGYLRWLPVGCTSSRAVTHLSVYIYIYVCRCIYIYIYVYMY